MLLIIVISKKSGKMHDKEVKNLKLYVANLRNDALCLINKWFIFAKCEFSASYVKLEI